jgi:hypothetical protein
MSKDIFNGVLKALTELQVIFCWLVPWSDQLTLTTLQNNRDDVPQYSTPSAQFSNNMLTPSFTKVQDCCDGIESTSGA